MGPGSSLYKAKCFVIKGEATNQSGQTVYNADVFGFVLDAYDEPAIPNRGRLASIPEIPPVSVKLSHKMLHEKKQILFFQFRERVSLKYRLLFLPANHCHSNLKIFGPQDF